MGKIVVVALTDDKVSKRVFEDTFSKALRDRGNDATASYTFVEAGPATNHDSLVATLRTGTPAPAPSTVRIAAARPFVPELTSSGRAIRGDVPLPEGRPYSLGNSSADYASSNATSEMSASSRSRGRAIENPRAVSYENDERFAAPATAYAPIDPRRPREILSGRGLSGGRRRFDLTTIRCRSLCRERDARPAGHGPAPRLGVRRPGPTPTPAPEPDIAPASVRTCS